jgi:hypothetical protein
MPGRKAVPWMMLLEAAVVARDHWGRLDARDRRELTRILRKASQRPGPRSLTPRERSELARIVRLLDPLTAGRKLLPFRGGVRRGR